MGSPLHRNRDFVALWTGQTVSALGTSISSLAYPLLVLALTGSPALAGLVGSVLAGATFLLRIPAGTVADRVDRKRLMLICDAGRLVAVGSLAVAVFAERATIVHIVLVALCEATFGVLFAPAEAVAVRRVVGRPQIREAVAVNQARQQLAGLIGPSVSGVLFGIGKGLPFLADALSYLVSFITIALIRTPLRDSRSPTPSTTRLRHELVEGVLWLWRQRNLRFITIWLSGAGLLFTSLGLVTLVIAAKVGASTAETGVAFTITGLGGLAGALMAPRIMKRWSSRAILITYAWIATASTFLLLMVSNIWQLGLVGALAFIAVPAANAIVAAQVVTDAPDHLQGRAVSATTQLTTLFHPIGPVVVGVLLQVLGTTTTVAAYGIAFAILATVICLYPFQRDSDVA